MQKLLAVGLILAVSVIGAQAQGLKDGTVSGGDAVLVTTDSVTALSDVSSVGSGSIITSAERTTVGAAVTNEQTGVTLAGSFSGNLDISGENVTDLLDVSSAGSGAIITTAERATVTAAITNEQAGAIVTSLYFGSVSEATRALSSNEVQAVAVAAASGGATAKAGTLSTAAQATNTVNFTTPFGFGVVPVVQLQEVWTTGNVLWARLAGEPVSNQFEIIVLDGTAGLNADGGLSVKWAATAPNNP